MYDKTWRGLISSVRYRKMVTKWIHKTNYFGYCANFLKISYWDIYDIQKLQQMLKHLFFLLSFLPSFLPPFLTSFTAQRHTSIRHLLLLLLLLLLLSGIYNPYEFKPTHSRGSEITHKDAPQSIGLLWTSDQPVADTTTWRTQHLQRTTIYAPGGIRTRSSSKRSAVDTRLRPLGHWDGHWLHLYWLKWSASCLKAEKYLSFLLSV